MSRLVHYFLLANRCYKSIIKKVIEKYEYNHNHSRVKAYDALGKVTTFQYDKNNRLIGTIDPSQHETSQTYDKVGNIETKTDGNGNVKSYAYDGFNQLTKVTNAKGESTTYTYDFNGNKLTQTDAKGNTITFAYNVQNLVEKKIQPGEEGKNESYTYYSHGKVKTKNDRKGTTTNYTYDIHGNLIQEKVGDTTITYTYDAKGNKLTMSDKTGTTTRTYDEEDRVLTKKVPHVGTSTFQYDLTESVDLGCSKERIQDPKGNVTEKVYDKEERLFQVMDGEDVTTYTYYDNGNRESITYPDGSKEEYTYYPNNQVKMLENLKADGSILECYQYTYDKAGNQLTKQETIHGKEKGTTSYIYDELNRLETVTEPSGRVTSYEYDRAGNRAKETMVAPNKEGQSVTTENLYIYNRQNGLTSITTKTDNEITKVTNYTYDFNGNQLQTEVDTYIGGKVSGTTQTAINTYDEYNQLIQTVTDQGAEVHNIYNAEGYRVVKEVKEVEKENGVKTYFLYEGDKVILEVDEEAKETARNVYGSNLLQRTVDGETYSYRYNEHADVTTLVTKKGTIAATYYYDAFGNILESTGKVNNHILYSGYQYDKETGLYYLNARMYDPQIARFLQEDTYMGDPNDPLSLNLYTYCHNEPVMYSDPSGHKEAFDKYINIKTAAGKKAIEDIKRADAAYKNADTKAERKKAIANAEAARAKYASSVQDMNYIAKKYGTETAASVLTVKYDKNIDKKNKRKEIFSIVSSPKTTKTGRGKPRSNAYIYYGIGDSQNGGFNDRAKADAKRYSTMTKNNAILIPIGNEKEFGALWNSMGNNDEHAEYVAMYFHSNPHNLIINADNNEYITSFSSGLTRDTEGEKAYSVNKLEKKVINNLYMYSCNSGHLSHTDDNLAITFMKNQDIKSVYAWDGSMKWGRDGKYTRLARSQEYFESWRDKGEKRKASGMIRYYKDNNGDIKNKVVKSSKKERDWLFWSYNLWETKYR